MNVSLPLLTCNPKYPTLIPALPLTQPHLLHPSSIPASYSLFRSSCTSTLYLQPPLLLTALFIYFHVFPISLISSSLAPSTSLTPLLQFKTLLPCSAPCPPTPHSLSVHCLPCVSPLRAPPCQSSPPQAIIWPGGDIWTSKSVMW